VTLLPRDEQSAPLADGSVIAQSDTSVPPDIDKILDATNRGLLAIPHDSLKTAVDESYQAFGGLGPELSRIVNGGTALAIDSRSHMDSLTTLIDQAGPVLDSQANTAGDIRAWAANLADLSRQVRDNDVAVTGLLTNGAAAADQARSLLDRIRPTLPIILTNLISVGQVALTYRNGVEQLLVLIPHGVSVAQAGEVANLNTKQDYTAGYLDFHLSINAPQPCATGFLPPQQRRTPAAVDAPNRPEGQLYCRVPQDSQLNVRGVRNLPCETVPGKRAPTVKMCESPAEYTPLNDGFSWKGDPNATLSGQGIPEPLAPTPSNAPAPQAVSMPPPLSVAEYDPATGSYVGPDGRVYTQSDLATSAPHDKTWQSMLIPPG
jgi:phospholipid/cholesterol/gamma-HCH transport system substrate-binding protein